MTSSFSKDTMGFCRKLKKSFFHLIIPVFIIYGIIITIHVINNHNSIEWKSYTASVINSLVFSSGVDVKIAGATIPALDSNISFLWSNIDNIAVSTIIKLAVDIGLCIILANVVHLISGAINNLSLKRNNIDKV